MKKLIVLLLSVACLLVFWGCNSLEQASHEKLSTEYTFSGKNDLFEISNGRIVLDEDNDIFRGGTLKIIQEEQFTNLASWAVTFYMVRDDENSVIKAGGATYNTDLVGHPSLWGEYQLAETSGKDFLFGSKGESKFDSLDDLINNFWVDLKVVDMNGKERVYQLQLTVTEVTS